MSAIGAVRFEGDHRQELGLLGDVEPAGRWVADINLDDASVTSQVSHSGTSYGRLMTLLGDAGG